MKIKNFELIETKGKNTLGCEYIAEVDVTTGLFRKRTVRKKVRREITGHWHFVDTGKFTPGYVVETLARAWTAQTGQPT